MKHIILSVACILVFATVAKVAAHDGAHRPVVLAQVDRAHAAGRDVSVSVTITGLDPDQAFAVSGFAVEGAQAVALDRPVPIQFAKDARIATRLRFTDTPPGIFTLTIDFGADGQGGVVVMPAPAPAAPLSKD